MKILAIKVKLYHIFLILMILIELGCENHNSTFRSIQSNLHIEKIESTIYFKECADSLTLINLMNSFVKRDSILFLKYFPKTFKEFLNIYDYNADKKCKLYESYFDHINYFFELTSNRDDWLNQILELSIEGKYKADASSLYQQHLRVIVMNNVDKVLLYLNSKNDCVSFSFWQYFLDGSENKFDKQITKLFENLCEKVKNEDNKQVIIIRKVFNSLYP